MTSPLYGEDLFGGEIVPDSRGRLSDVFVVPPTSVLNTRDGFWMERKRAWKSLGIQGEIGRSAAMGNAGATSPYRQINDAVSVFDPVLTELSYRWFCPAGGLIIDPFAGGSVRGVVAGSLGYRYWGVELREEQVYADRAQFDLICPDADVKVEHGDALDRMSSAPSEADFLFSCPPYGNLERYSDDPRDLSAMSPHDFDEAYRRIIAKSVSRLADDRFAAFVVGDFRDKSGAYRGFVADTVAAFVEAGCSFYNEAIVVTPIGGIRFMLERQFTAGRKLGKCHQNLLVFCKGDWKRAAAHIRGCDD